MRPNLLYCNFSVVAYVNIRQNKSSIFAEGNSESHVSIEKACCELWSEKDRWLVVRFYKLRITVEYKGMPWKHTGSGWRTTSLRLQKVAPCHCYSFVLMAFFGQSWMSHWKSLYLHRHSRSSATAFMHPLADLGTQLSALATSHLSHLVAHSMVDWHVVFSVHFCKDQSFQRFLQYCYRRYSLKVIAWQIWPHLHWP